MEADKLHVTRKIQLLIDSSDEKIKKQVWKTLSSWQRICFKAANHIMTHQFVLEQIKELFFLTEEAKVKLADIKKDENGILSTSKGNTTYQSLSKRFKSEIPMNIITALNNKLVGAFNSDIKAYREGEKSLRNYKRNIDIPIPAIDIRRITLSEDKKYYTFNIFGHPFKTYFGKDINDKRSLWAAAQSGQNKLCTSSLKIDNGKIFLLATFEISKDKNDLDLALVAEASLSPEIPIIVRIGNRVHNIGTKEEFLFRRLAIQEAWRRRQKGAASNRSKNGKVRQLQSIEDFRDKEYRYTNYKAHQYSRKLINLCVKSRSATLILLNQQEKEDMAQQNAFLLRNWSYANLKQKICYKAEKAGINVIIE